MWDRWRKGGLLHRFARLFHRHHLFVRAVFAETDGFQPATRRRSVRTVPAVLGCPRAGQRGTGRVHCGHRSLRAGHRLDDERVGTCVAANATENMKPGHGALRCSRHSGARLVALSSVVDASRSTARNLADEPSARRGAGHRRSPQNEVSPCPCFAFGRSP